MTQERRAITFILGLLAVMAAVYFLFLHDRTHPRQITDGRLQAVKQAVLEFANANRRLPESLQELEISMETIKDHAGVPFVYRHDASTVTLISYGADGKPGGVLFNKDQVLEFTAPPGE